MSDSTGRPPHRATLTRFLSRRRAHGPSVHAFMASNRDILPAAVRSLAGTKVSRCESLSPLGHGGGEARSRAINTRCDRARKSGQGGQARERQRGARPSTDGRHSPREGRSEGATRGAPEVLHILLSANVHHHLRGHGTRSQDAKQLNVNAKATVLCKGNITELPVAPSTSTGEQFHFQRVAELTWPREGGEESQGDAATSPTAP